jgi:hypothetical protein
VLLYYFGDNPEHFDLIYIGALGLSCVFCWADKDTLGALIILLGLWCLSEAIYLLPEHVYSLILTYALCLILSAIFIDQITAKITLVITLYSIGAEFFWWYTDYTNKPLIHYLIGLLALTGLARELLLKRVILLSEYFAIHSGKVALDWQIRTILSLYYVLMLLVVLEYFIRHLMNFPNLTFIYYKFSLVASILSGLTLILIYSHYFYNQSKKHIQA